ncbi:MAG: polyhydroxyalkanoic acid system family protein [Sandaracinaceae bacterium]|nr:polyhydroxyalkanoic acid system family protein [Sandaracinaceae bacterium]
MKHSVSHDLDVATAKRVTEKAYEAYKEKFASYNPSMRWVSDSRAETTFSIKGSSLKGTFDILPREIQIDLEVPFLFKMFQSKAISIIETEIKKWVAKAKAGEV